MPLAGQSPSTAQAAQAADAPVPTHFCGAGQSLSVMQFTQKPALQTWVPVQPTVAPLLSTVHIWQWPDAQICLSFAH
jgi:hypothetical protein